MITGLQSKFGSPTGRHVTWGGEGRAGAQELPMVVGACSTGVSDSRG
jgi:hypothetical protein